MACLLAKAWPFFLRLLSALSSRMDGGAVLCWKRGFLKEPCGDGFPKPHTPKPPKPQSPQTLYTLSLTQPKPLRGFLPPSLSFGDCGSEGPAWSFMGSYKWSYKSPNIGYNYSYPTSKPTYNYPFTLNPKA